ncbi:MAG: MFS transporter, partial [Alphaproteobacteria bacterium]|nr:MFS transporter [Alphaproteobacteria bacterium]
MRTLRTTHPLDRNVYLLNLLTFLDNALFVIPIIVVYYAAHKSVGFTGFLIGEAAFALVMVVMEVPSGYLSDIWRRKSVLWLAMAWQVVGFALLWLGDGLVAMVAAQSIVGIGASLYSGTNTAMLYDGLLERGKAATFSKYSGQHQMYGMIGATGAALIGGFAYALQPDLPAILTVIVMVIATAATWFLTEPNRHKQVVQKTPIADMVSVMKYTLHGHKEVACLILFMTSVFVT